MSNNQHNTDVAFAVSFAKGMEEGLKWYYHSLFPVLCLFAIKWLNDKETAEELTNDAFIKTWRNPSQLNTPGAIKAYLYQVVKNDCIKYVEKQKRKSNRSSGYLPGTVNEETGFSYLVTAELHRLMDAEINALPTAAAKVIRMHFLEGRSVAEIASDLNLSPSTIKNQRQSGLKALRKKIKKTLLFFIC